MQNHRINQKWRSGVLLVKVLSLVLTFLKTVIVILWTLSTTPRWSIASLCLNYDENMCLSDVWFHQKGATVHIARASVDVLYPHFGDRLISKFADCPWAPCASDLSICDYFLWGYPKAHVYEHNAGTLEERINSRGNCPNWQNNARKCGGQIPRTLSEMNQWKRTFFPNLNLSNPKSMWTQ